MQPYERVYVRITYEKTKGKFPWEHHALITWSKMGIQNVQAKEVY